MRFGKNTTKGVALHYCNDCFAVFESVSALCPKCKSPDIVTASDSTALEPNDGIAKPGQVYFELNKDGGSED